MKIAHSLSVANIYTFQNLNLAKELLSEIDQLASAWRPANRYLDKSIVPNLVSDIELTPLRDLAKNWFNRCLRRVAYTDMGSGHQLAVSDLWLTRSELGSSTHQHNHPLSVYSGIFYLQDAAQGTWFDLPRWYHTHWPHMFSHRSPFNKQRWQQPCTQGTLVIFPSYLEHWVEVQTTEEIRYSLPWNSFWQGNINSNLGTRLGIRLVDPV